MCHARKTDCVIIAKKMIFPHVMPDLIRHPVAFDFEKTMDSQSVIPDLIRDRNDKNSKCVVLLLPTRSRKRRYKKKVNFLDSCFRRNHAIFRKKFPTHQLICI